MEASGWQATANNMVFRTMPAEKLDIRRRTAEHRRFSAIVAVNSAIAQPNAEHLHLSNISGKSHSGTKEKERERIKEKEKVRTQAKEKPKESLVAK